MSRAEELFKTVHKTIGDTPLYLLAGAGDLVAERLRELPNVLESAQQEYRDLPMRAAGAVMGSLFKANIKAGELFDELTRRGRDVVDGRRGSSSVAEEDEPFVHEPFMPPPVHPSAHPTAANRPAAAKRAQAKKAAGEKPARRHPTSRPEA